MLILSVLLFTLNSGAWAGSCSLAVLGGVPKLGNPNVKLEINSTQANAVGAFHIDATHSAKHSSFFIHHASALVTSLSRLFEPATKILKPHHVNYESMIEVYIVESFDQIERLESAPSKTVQRFEDPAIIVDVDMASNYKRIFILSAALNQNLNFNIELPKTLFASPGITKTVKERIRSKKNQAHLLHPKMKNIFVGGLISISAEPPEGFFAASTQAELKKLGWKTTASDKADIWLYRVPDSRSESYFKFHFPSEDRPKEAPYSNKFKIAVGIGPMNNPSSEGGREADLLWLGDEQEGRMSEYLKLIQDPNFSIDDLRKFYGFVQRTSPTSVWVGNIGLAHNLTQKGFNQLVTDVSTYRKVYSREYDQSLLTLFQHSKESEKFDSYLLATSRGCSQGCSLCCSGGLSEFQYFTATRMMEELNKIAEHASLLKDDKKLNIFFLDSNFNNNPTRIIEFAKLYRASPLYKRLQFFVRHNTVNGFLKAVAGSAEKIPNEELIQAYHTLGIDEVFMGVDSYDDASTFTLKTHRNKVAKGIEGGFKPIYSSKELKSLIASFDQKGMYTKCFYLKNNPWVTDLDRIDSYYNLMELALLYRRFSIDTRNEDVNRLKPFAGSPIAAVSEPLPSLTDNHRYVARTELGELDEMMHFKSFGAHRMNDVGLTPVIDEWLKDITTVKQSAEKLKNDYGRKILSKLSQKEAELLVIIKKVTTQSPAESQALQKLNELTNHFLSTHPVTSHFSAQQQLSDFSESSATLVSGLKHLHRADKNEETGYDASLDQLQPHTPHTIKNLNAYLKSNLGEETLKDIKSDKHLFKIILGDGHDAFKNLPKNTQLRLIEKKEGFHQVYQSSDGSVSTYYIVRVNGHDRKIHIQSLLKLAGVSEKRVSTLGEHKSWKNAYIKTFKKLGSPPDAVFYGFSMSVLGAFLLENKLQNILQVKKFYSFKNERTASPDIRKESDLSQIYMYLVKFKNGKKIWIFNNLYGDLSRDLLLALLQVGAKNIISASTAGAITSKFKVGEVIDLSISNTVVYERVSTPNIETESWLQNKIASNVDLVDVETGYWLDIARITPTLNLKSILMVSDVLSGPHRRDMTEWNPNDGKALTPKIISILKEMLKLEKPSFIIDKMERIHLVSD